jgi:hypothetical protein
MKHFLISLSFSFFTLNIFAQTTIPTTNEMVTYITGRLVRDQRDGYGFKPNASYETSGYISQLSWSDGWRKAELCYYKENDNIAAYLIWLTDSWGNFDLRVIPTRNSLYDVTERCRKIMTDDSQEWKNVYLSLLLDMAKNHLY